MELARGIEPQPVYKTALLCQLSYASSLTRCQDAGYFNKMMSVKPYSSCAELSRCEAFITSAPNFRPFVRSSFLHGHFYLNKVLIPTSSI